ncbi:MAG: hypothetical protein H0T78_03055 [Longispora sp.]|nr:hypothetical protein [Longispora sp. (in: high G+C Gram-positive bacteria)]
MAKDPDSKVDGPDETVRDAVRTAKLELLKAIERYASEASSAANVKDLAFAFAAVMGTAAPPRMETPPGPPYPLRPSRKDWPA